MTTCQTTRISLASAALAALLGGCATVGPQASLWEAAPVGATWETAQRNTGSFGKDAQIKVTRGAGTWQGEPAVALAISSGATLFQRPQDGAWMALVDRNGQPMATFDPPVGPQWPLKVGKSWSGRHRMTVPATGRVTEYDISCNVEAYEKVTVRAGTFDAYKVHCNSSTGSEDTYWLSPKVHPFIKRVEQRGASHPAGPGTQESELISRG